MKHKFFLSIILIILLILPLLSFAEDVTGAQISSTINNIYRISLGAATLLALLMMVLGGYYYMTAAGNAERSGKGVEIITSSLLGIVILFCAYVLLRTINPDLVNLKLKDFKDYTAPVEQEMEQDQSASSFSETKRMIAVSQSQVDEASEAGCVEDGDMQGVTVFECPTATVSKLSLTEGMRVIATTKEQTIEAKNQGCVVALTDKDFEALECPQGVVDNLDLPEDTKVYLTDTVSNEQAGANLAHNLGINGKGVKVAVLDTGIDYKHPELQSSYIGGFDFVDNDKDPMDKNGHGTHVAGIITGDGIDSAAKGIAPDAQILAYKVLNDKGNGSVFGWGTTVAKAMIVANLSGAQIISMSAGSSSKRSATTCDSYDQLLTGVIKFVTEKGSNVVIAAGNEGDKVSWPGCVGNAITVGAVDPNDTVAGFSGRGGSLDITAPGVDIFSTIHEGRYGKLSGTSMATPQVSGALALIRSAHPEFSNRQAEDLLYSSAKDLGASSRDDLYGWGRIDLVKALNINQTANSTADLKVNGSDGPISVARGSTVKINLTSSGVVSCETSPIGWNSTSGSITFGPINNPVTLSVSCTGSNGNVADSVAVTLSTTPLYGFTIKVYEGDPTKNIRVPNTNVLLVADDRSNPSHGTTAVTNNLGEITFSDVYSGGFNVELRNTQYENKDYYVLINSNKTVAVSLIKKGTTPPPSVEKNSYLLPGKRLNPNDFIISDNEQYVLNYQLDGNLVVSKKSNKPLWATNTDNVSPGFVEMQFDGNLVVYDSDHNPVWASNTEGNLGAFLLLQNDGNLVIYDKNNKPLWATGTN